MENAEDVKEMKPCDLGKFQLKRVLNDDLHSKVTYLEGSFGTDDPAVVILEKLPFTQEHSAKLLKVSHENSEKTFQNDVYSGYKVDAKMSNEIKATVIYPATQKHIDKYSKQSRYLVRETAEIYREKVLPFLEKSSFSLQWVYNILDKKAEQESVLFEDNDPKLGFILCKDMKWTMDSTDDLHILGIVHDRSLRSIRSLRAEHLELLKNLRSKTIEFVEKKFSLGEDQIMMYFHYQPSYYLLHLHVVALTFENPPGGGCQRGHLIDTVISNLEICGDYYDKATICYVLNENEPLRKAIQSQDGQED